MLEKGKFLETAGIVAVVYGVGNYLVVNLDWPEYLSWVAGGVILILVGWAKRSMGNK